MCALNQCISLHVDALPSRLVVSSFHVQCWWQGFQYLGGNPARCVAFSSAVTCPSQLDRGTSANKRTEGGAEVGGAELYKVCAMCEMRSEIER